MARGDRHLHRLTQPDAAQALAETRTAIVVVGSVEQHGPHLPLGTDALAALRSRTGSPSARARPCCCFRSLGVAPYHGCLGRAASRCGRRRSWRCSSTPAAGSRPAARSEDPRRQLARGEHADAPARRRRGAARGRRAGRDRGDARDRERAPPRRDGVHPRRRDGDRRGARPRPVARPPRPRRRGDPGRGRRPRPRPLPPPRRLPDPAGLRRDRPDRLVRAPERVSAERAAEILDEVADHVVARAAEVWEALER